MRSVRRGHGRVRGGAVQVITHLLRGRGYGWPLLADRQRYKGRGRRVAGQAFDATWIARQQELQLPVVLPDAGYVAEGDAAGLRSVLDRSAAIAGAAAPLALANWWLYGPGLRLLVAELTDRPVPVALAIEHDEDPLGVRRVLEGVVTLLRAEVTLIPLRCDASALGLLAHGALATAYGSKTSLRHLYPLRDNDGGPTAGRESALWPAGMALHYHDRLHDTVAVTPDDPRWRCSCAVCADQRLDRLDTAMREEIRAHNTASLLDLRSSLVASSAPAGRAAVWSSWCATALRAHEEVSAEAAVLNAPKALQHWRHL